MGEDRYATRRDDDGGALAQAFEQLPVIVGTVHGRDYVFVAANAAYRAFSAERPILGLPAREVFAEAVSQQVFEMLDLAYDTGRTQSGREWRIQLDRGAGLVDIYIDFVISPIIEPGTADGGGGEVTGLNLLITEVTEQVTARKAAQALAVEAERRYEVAQGVIVELQRELLPPGVPVVPGLEIAASYLLADADTAAGGDWFDAIALRDGRVALVVGDVVGHGVRASAVMGQLRVLLWDRLTDTGDVALALEAVDGLAERVRAARAATVCVVVVDPVDGELSYCTAGHPPPLIVPATGRPRYLAPTGNGPLAVSGTEFAVARDRLGPGDLVLLYSDGILERPGRDLAGASVELAQVAADVAAGRALRTADATVAERVATQTLELLTRASGHTDDITLLAAQRVPTPADLAVAWPATAPILVESRSVLAGWLEELHVSAEDAQTVQHALGELVANAVEHAYRDHTEQGPVEVTATVTGVGELRAQVRDRGRWREPATAFDAEGNRGRGLWMVSELADELTVEHPGGATVASVIYRLSRPARLLTADALTPAPVPVPAARTALDIDHHTAGTLRISGPIDTATAPGFAAAVARASAGGTRDLVLDLAGVTHLASAGVSVLAAAELRGLAGGTDLRLFAPAGSPADQILTLVAIPHVTGADNGDPGRT